VLEPFAGLHTATPPLVGAVQAACVRVATKRIMPAYNAAMRINEKIGDLSVATVAVLGAEEV
jgi:hypothetical protein